MGSRGAVCSCVSGFSGTLCSSPVVRQLPGCPLVAPLAGLSLAGLEARPAAGAASVPASPTREVPALCALLQQTAVGLEQRLQSAGSTGSRRSSRRASFFSCKGDGPAGRAPPLCLSAPLRRRAASTGPTPSLAQCTCSEDDTRDVHAPIYTVIYIHRSIITHILRRNIRSDALG